MLLPLKPHRRSLRRGVAVMEFVVVFPLILLLLIGLLEVGRLINAQQILSNACREAGRQASTGSKTTTEVEQTIHDYLARANIDPTGFTFAMQNLTASARNDPTTAEQLDHFEIVATLPYRNVRWIDGLFFTNDSTILQARVDWYSMRDIPVEVNVSLPVE